MIGGSSDRLTGVLVYNTEVETTEKKEGKETKRNEIGDKNRTTEERVDCEFEEY